MSSHLQPLGGQSPAQLRYDPVHGGEVGQRTGGQRAVELAQWPRRRQVAGALDLRALELPAQQRLEAAQCLARQTVVAGILGRQLRLGLGAQTERATDPLHVYADHARALLAAGERRDRHSREVAHGALRAIAQRGGDLRSQRVELVLAELAEARPGCSSLTPSREAATSTARKKKRSKTSSNTRRSSWLLASVAASASRKSSCEVQLISRRTSNASSISEVPTATPSRRSSSPSSSIRAGRPSAARAAGCLRRHRRASGASARPARPPRPCRCGA